MRALLLLAPILLGLLGGAAARVVEGQGRFEVAPVAWELGELDAAAFEETADVDAILALRPPAGFRSDRAWVEFGRRVGEIDTGSRYSGARMTSPLLGWIAYIAHQRPRALFTLYDEGVVTASHLGHLLEMGLAADWHEFVEDVDGLILSSPSALASLALAKGMEPARRRVADAFFARPELAIRLDPDCLRFGLPAMSDAEIERVVPQLRSSAYDFDPRGVRRLLLDERFREKAGDLLPLLEEPGSDDRSTASYLVDAALLGGLRSVELMILDAADNAGTYTHWYCAACGLALATDGLLGSALIETVGRGEGVTLRREGDTIAIEPGAAVPAGEGAP